MATFGSLLKSLLTSILRTDSTTPQRPPAPAQEPVPSRPSGARQDADANEPGRYGTEATVEIDPRSIGSIRTSYTPSTDGDPDPGEIVWTWVPFEERDGRGKDRPVLIVASEKPGTVLAVQLTSKPHGGERDFIAVGAGGWDFDGRPSWINIDRVFRVRPGGMRREAASLDRANFDRVASALGSRYGWKSGR